MEELKTLFGDGSLTYEQFEKKLAGAGDKIRLANLKSGKYVVKDKYDKQVKRLEKYKTNLATNEGNDKQYASLKAEYNSVSTKYNDLLKKQDLETKMGLIKNANVDNRFAEFVYSKVSASERGKKDFQKALSEFLKNNSQYLNASKGTFVDLQNGSTAPKSSSETINKWIRGEE